MPFDVDPAVLKDASGAVAQEFPDLAVEPGEAVVRNAERMKFFTDAVVAIAMTLLILPLLEVSRRRPTTASALATFCTTTGTSSSASR